MRKAFAVVLLTVLAFSALSAPASATHDGAGGQLVPDGYATLVSGENSLEQENTLIVSPDDGAYEFTMELRNDGGDEVDFDSLGWAVFTVDAAQEDGFDPTNATDTSEYVEAVGSADNVDDDHEATFRIPTSAVSFGAAVPEDGAAIYAWAQDKETNGGAVSLAANAHAEAGEWSQADEADQQFTPVFLVNADSDALIEANNPIFNPDFTLGDASGQDVASPVQNTSTGQGVVAPTAAPPWFAHVSNKAGEFPNSTTKLEAVDGGRALQVDVSPSDIKGDSALYIGQQFSDATEAFPGRQEESPMPLNWQDPQELKVDARLPTDQETSEVQLSLAVEWASNNDTAGSPRIIESKTVTLDASDDFQTFEIDFEDNADFDSHPEKNLSRVLLGIDKSTFPSEDIEVDFDNVRLNGAELDPVMFEETQGDSLADSSITDGHAVHIEPVDRAQYDGERTLVSTDPFETVKDSRYLFEVTVWDTKEDKKVDPAEFDVDDFQIGRADPFTGNTSTGGGQFTFIDAYEAGLDYANQKARLVVVNASDVPDDKVTSAWYWASIDGGTPPQDAAGYHSILKNQFEGFAAADQLDWAATPLRFANGSAGSFQYDSFVEGFSVDQQNETTTVTVGSDSPVLERLDVKILDRNGDLVASGTTDPVADTQSDTITLGDDIQENGAIKVESAEVTSETLVELGPPVVTIDDSQFPSDLTDGDEVDLTPGEYVDPDLNPGITSAEWTIEVTYFEDNEEKVVTESFIASDDDGDDLISKEEATIESVQFPDAGVAEVTLEIQTNDDETASATVSGIAVDNAGPELGPNPLSVIASDDGAIIESDAQNTTWTAKAGHEVSILSTGVDPSPLGSVTGDVLIEADNTGKLLENELRLNRQNISLEFEVGSRANLDYVLPSPGDYEIEVFWTDDEGLTTSVTGLVKARQPEVSAQESNTSAVVDDASVDDAPLPGENLSANLTVEYTGDRPADLDNDTLELVAPDDSVVTATTKDVYDPDGGSASGSMVAEYSLDAAITQTGDYTLRLAGETFNGVSLADVYSKTITVEANQNPTVAIEFPDKDAASDGLHYAEIGEAVSLDANASDADCADDNPRCDLTYSWGLSSGPGSVSADAASSTFTGSAASPSKASPHQVEVTVTDHLGATSTTTVPVVVDDRLEFQNVDVDADWATTLSGNTEASGQVVDDLGNPVDAFLSWELRYSPTEELYEAGIQRVVDQGEKQLDASGQFQVDFDDEVALLNRPGYYEVSFTAQEPEGRIDRPDQAPNSGGSGPNGTVFEETSTIVESARVQTGAQPTLQVEGACYYQGQGAQDSAGYTPSSGLVAPSPSATQDGAAACATAATNGSTPQGGSFLRLTAGGLGQQASASTVPVTNALTGALPLP